MNGKKARAIRKTFGVEHVREAGLTKQATREFPRRIHTLSDFIKWARL